MSGITVVAKLSADSDAVTCTLGHEIMHIALGEYHK